jgi:hypothetical protein
MCKVLKSVLLFVVVALLSACAASQKTQIVQISTVDRNSSNTMKSVKCAIQQAGWNITYSDSESVSATKAHGLDSVPVTLNIRLTEQKLNTTKAVFTMGNPRGVYGNGDYYSKNVIDALNNCGAKGLVVEEEGTDNKNKPSSKIDESTSANTNNLNKSSSETLPKIIKTEPVAEPTYSVPITKKSIEIESEADILPQTAPTTMIITSNKAKIRKKPSTKADVVKNIKKGEVVQVIKQSDDWFQIELASGDVGWCHKSVLEKSN